MALINRIVKLCLSDIDFQGFTVYYIINENTTGEDLFYHMMDEVFKFTEKHNLIELNERLSRRIFHCHENIEDMIHSDQLTYYICTGCGSEDELRDEQQKNEWNLKINNMNPENDI